MKRLGVAVTLCLVLALSVTAASAQSSDDACMQKGGTLTTDGKCMLTIDAKVSVDYPLDLAQRNPLIASTIDPYIDQAKNDFMQAVGQAFIPAPGPYELDISYNTVTHSDTILTLVLSVYQFTGGAHGSTTIQTYTFDLQNNKVLTLDDLFTNTTAALQIIAPIAQTTIAANVGDMNQPDMLQAGTAIDPTNYAAFALDTDSITFYFQDYQVAPYAAGIQQVTIPLAQLSSVLKPGFTS